MLNILNNFVLDHQHPDLADLLEMCQFKVFWERIHQQAELIKTVAGFEDSIRRFI